MNVLSIQGSIGGSASVTRALSAAYLDRLKAAHPDVAIVEHDLAAQPLAHLGGEMVAVQLGMGGEPSEAASLGNRLISELERCDVLVLGSPMYNFGIPSTIKAWFDYVLRVGKTFRYVNGAPEGLLPPGKKAIVFVASGGVYSEGPGKQVDFLEPHLRWLLAFIGITNVEFVRAEGLVYGAEAAKAATDAARGKALALAAA